MAVGGTTGKYSPPISLGDMINKSSPGSSSGKAGVAKAAHPPPSSPLSGKKVEVRAAAGDATASSPVARPPGRPRAGVFQKLDSAPSPATAGSPNRARGEALTDKSTKGAANQEVAKATFQFSDVISRLGFTRGNAVPILDKKIEFLDAGGNKQTSSIRDVLLQNIREDLDNNITEEQLTSYITAGDRLINEIIAPHQGDFREDTVFTYKNMAQRGKEDQFKPTLECVRAISWYLQAKALDDNFGHGEVRPLAKLTTESGAMFALDPGNKIFKFMNACTEAYNRESSHVKERNPEPKQKLGDFASNQANLSKLGVLINGSSPVSKGIDDPGGKMPGAGSTLLFAKMRAEQNGKEQLFLKWEPYGVAPWDKTQQNDTFDEGAQLHDSKATRGGIVYEGFRHATEFAGGIKDKVTNKVEKKVAEKFGREYVPPDKSLYLGEKLESGSGGVYKERFDKLIDGSGYLKTTYPDAKTEVSKFGAAKLDELLDDIVGDSGASLADQTTALRLKTELGEWMSQRGADLGISRKGAEIHVNPYRAH